jgi:hypothetical protein
MGGGGEHVAEKERVSEWIPSTSMSGGRAIGVCDLVKRHDECLTHACSGDNVEQRRMAHG